MTNAKKLWIMAVVLSLASSPVVGHLDFNDGQTHDIDYQINTEVWVDYQAPGMQTTVNLLNGGSILYDLRAYEDSWINIIGGSIGRYLFPDGNSQVNIFGGSIGSDLAAGGSSQTNISGGLIANYLRAYDHSHVNISGGSIGGDLAPTQWAVLTIYGSDFAVDGAPFGYGKLTSILGGNWQDEPLRYLTGILSSGQPIDNDFYIGHEASIILVPEPATIILFALGSLALRRTKQPLLFSRLTQFYRIVNNFFHCVHRR